VVCKYVDAYSVMCTRRLFTTEHLDKPFTRKFWFDIGVSVLLVLGAGMAAGLTMGIMSLDLMNLEILQKSGTPREQYHATRIIPLVKEHHLLLVTLLLVNACCNEALPLFLDELMHPLQNIVVSVTALLLFGEIIPQAVCTRYGLAIGATAAPLVWALMWTTWVITYPIAKLLDCCLGHDTHAYYRRAQLKELVDLHGHINSADFEEALSPDECTIIRGALDLKNKTVGDCLTSIEHVTMLNYEGVLDTETMQRIVSSGHSRIPVYVGMQGESREGNQQFQILGMILVKSLVMLDPAKATPVRECQLRRVPLVPTTKPLYDMLNLFQEGRSHIAVAVDPRDHMTYRGVITLEDVIEQLIQEPIADETDNASNRTLYVTFRPTAEAGGGDKRPAQVAKIHALAQRKSPTPATPTTLNIPAFASMEAGLRAKPNAHRSAADLLRPTANSPPDERTPLVARCHSDPFIKTG